MKRLNRIYYKCTEPNAFPYDPNEKVTRKIKDATEPIRRGNLIAYLGCACEFWVKGKYDREMVEFT